jgi:hypothetical protein
MRYLAVLLVLCLIGCSTAPVVVKFPSAPAELIETCPDLKMLETDTTKLSKALEVVADNYNQYYQCQLKVDNWIEWYKTQKKIFDSLN